MTAVSAGLVIERVATAAPEAESAQAILKALDTNTPEAKATQETRARAKAALERALRFRDSHDEGRARIAEVLALRLAELARDQARALHAEDVTANLLRSAQDAGAEVERDRALVEESLAQGGRLRAQLEALELEKKREPERTARGALSSDGGAPKRPAPATSAALPSATPDGTPKKQPAAGRDGGAQ